MITYSNTIKCLSWEHSKISQLINEDIFKCAVSEIIIGPKNSSDVFPVVIKLREQLERTSTGILSFLEECTRNIHEKLHLKTSFKSEKASKLSTDGPTLNRRFNAEAKIFLFSLCRHHSPYSLLISSTHFLGNVFVKEQCGRGSVSRIMT